MSKWYEVKVVKVTVFAVEVEDVETEIDATNYALQEESGMTEAECSAQIIGEENIDRLKRHADEVLESES